MRRTVLTTCAYCGVGCVQAEMQGGQVVQMVPYKDGAPRGSLLREGPPRGAMPATRIACWSR